MEKYEKELEYMTNYLITHNGESSRRSEETFRKRSQHARRCLVWADRICKGLKKEELERLDRKALDIAIIFHDIGYGSELYHNSHAIEGSEIFKNYADSNKYDMKLTDKIYYLIRTHSNKELLKTPNKISLELRILMEADWLDEEGAMSICWDLMNLSKKNPEDYTECLEKIKKYSAHILDENPMVDSVARKYWQHKQEFVRNFIKELEFDLCNSLV